MYTDEYLLDVLMAAAILGGKIVKKSIGTAQDISFELKSSHADLVTETDIYVDNKIKSLLTSFCPDIAIISEESGWEGFHDEVFIIDPIDGTLNYSHGFNEVAISLGYWKKQSARIGVVYNPIQDKLYHSVKDGGAYLNGSLISVSKRNDIKRSLLCSGWPYDKKLVAKAGREMGKLVRSCQEVRLLGSAALAMCKVADGTFEGYWEAGLFPWDIAGAVPILLEAGGECSSLAGEKFELMSGEILATNGKVHNQIKEKLIF